MLSPESQLGPESRPRRLLKESVLQVWKARKAAVPDGIANAERVSMWHADGPFPLIAESLDRDYFELLTAAPGNTGLYVGQPGDGRTVGLTLRLAVKSR